MKVTATKTVDAPRERVFDVFADIAAVEDRVEGITKVDILSDVRSGLGTRWRETRVMMGKEATEEMEMVEFSPPSRYVVTAASRGNEYRSVYDFADKGTGTEVTMVFEGTPVSLGAKLMAPLMLLFAGASRKMLEADMDDLAKVCEDGNN